MKKIIIIIQILTIIILLTATSPEAVTQEQEYYLMTATAYYPGPESCAPFDDGFTAIGDIAGKGCIAIDDKTGPFKMGQMVYIEGYGIGKCNDRGSAIKYYKIDLCFDTQQEALNWGRKLVKVYVIEGGN